MKKSNLKLILASGSPRRKQLLEDIGVPFEVITSHADEDVNGDVSPEDYVRTVAKRKADAVLKILRSVRLNCCFLDHTGCMLENRQFMEG